MELPRKPTLAIDFDGVIHSYVSGWQGADVIPDPPVPGAIEALLGYLENFTVCIHSSRFNAWQETEGRWPHPRAAIRHWFENNGISNALVNYDADKFGLDEDRINLCATKPPALVTLDDRGWMFTGTFPSADEIKAFQTWQKRGV